MSEQVTEHTIVRHYLDNPKSTKYYVKKFLESCPSLEGKIVVDAPAGNGSTSQMLLKLGAKVRAFDLFPEYFRLSSLNCERADISNGLPLNDGTASMIICQEGIEHISDQLRTLKEFNRILEMGGKLIITTPSYSNLAAKFSYLLFESETSTKMPPNEIDDIWMSDKSINNEAYYGHLFLIGLQKLRTLAKISGFKISEVKYLRLSKGSLYLFPFFYPLIVIRSLHIYYKHMRQNTNLPDDYKKKVYGEQLRLNLNPSQLLNKHTFVVFEKEPNATDVDFRSEKVGFDQET